MNNFVFQNTTKIIFGKDTQKEIGSYVKKYSNKVLLHYGGGSIKATGLYEEVINSLKSENIEIFELSGVKPNPELSLVYEGIKICRDNNINFVLAVGGGSAIDSSKAIALGVNYDGDVWDFFEGKAKPTNVLPLATILTIPAAGSESSINTVITKEDGLLKVGFGHELLRPVFSILNPELCFTLPPIQMANGVADMIAHVFERYFTNTLNTQLIDSFSESLVKTVMTNALKLKKCMTNYDAWAEIMWAGTIAHNSLLETGRVTEWSSHRIEHELSALYNIAHGSGLSIIFPAWIKYVYKENLDMFVQFAINIFNINPNIRDREQIVLAGIEALERFYKELGLPTRLSDLNIDNKDFELMAKKLSQRGKLGSIKNLMYDDIINIYTLAL